MSLFDPARIPSLDVIQSARLERVIGRIRRGRSHISVRSLPMPLVQAQVIAARQLERGVADVQVAATTVGLDWLLYICGDLLGDKLSLLQEAAPMEAMQQFTPRGFLWASPMRLGITSITVELEVRSEVDELRLVSGLPLQVLGIGTMQLGLLMSDSLPLPFKHQLRDDAVRFRTAVEQALR